MMDRKTEYAVYMPCRDCTIMPNIQATTVPVQTEWLASVTLPRNTKLYAFRAK